MRKNIELTNEQMNNYLNKFYEYFQTGYEFEEFLKIYLEKLGLDEVSVTKRSRDGGIDLKAVRNGVGGFSDADAIEYYVQAKKNKPDSTVSVTKIRELKGTIPFGNKGIFITTAKFSSDAIIEAKNDKSKPVILIDGKTLIDSCIDNEIGFVFTPVFSKAAMDALKPSNMMRNEEIDDNTIDNDVSPIVVERQITQNDIRARILVVPKMIMNRVPPDKEEVWVRFNRLDIRKLNIDKGRRYLAGVTELFRESGLIVEDGSYNSKKSIWKYDGDQIEITLKE